MAGVYANRDDLITHILEELKVVPAGQPAAATEFEVVDEHLNGILGELGARNIIGVGNTDQIPIEIMEGLAQAVGRRVANLFSIPDQEVDQMFKPEEHPFSPENRLRAITRSRPLYTPATPDYF